MLTRSPKEAEHIDEELGTNSVFDWPFLFFLPFSFLTSNDLPEIGYGYVMAHTVGTIRLAQVR